MNAIQFTEALIVALYPLISFAAWCIVIYQNLRYRRRIKELDELVLSLKAAIATRERT